MSELYENRPMRVSEILKNNKWTLLYLLWMCGVMIVYSTCVTDPDDRHDLVTYNSLFTFLLSIVILFIAGKPRKVFLIAFFIIAICPSLIETGWFLIDKSALIRTQFWVIFGTNPFEAAGLLSMIQIWQWLLLFCYLAIAIALLTLSWSESERQTSNGSISIVASVFSVSLIFIPGIRYNVPCINFYNSYCGYCADIERLKDFMQSRTDLKGKVMDEFPDCKATIVVIIGESLTRNHCSLYGYCRQTTPLLDSRKDIVVFNNVESPDFMTQAVLQQVLTFANKENAEALWNSPTLPELLNAAGWHTYWYDPYEGRNNTSNSLPTGFQTIAKLCTTYALNGENEQFDEAHINHLLNVMQDTTIMRKAVFLHLIGNHFPYERRYPKAFEHFVDEDVCSPYANRLSSKQKDVINAYDNAVYYNDWLVDSVLNILNQQSYNCAMLYFSDHGEEVYDYDFYAGRSFNHITRSLYEIPCIFWQNEMYSKSNPLYLNQNASYCTDDMIHSLLDIFAVSYAQKDTCRSLFRHRKTLNGPVDKDSL